MGLLISVTLGALLIGWISGGRLARLALLPLRGWPLALAAAGCVFIGAAVATADGTTGRVGATAGPALAAGCLIALLVRNRTVEGMPLLAVGLLLNAVVIGVNGAMPVSSYAQARAGAHTAVYAGSLDPTHEWADRTTRLRPLGDVVPVALPWHPETVSPGDVLIVAGVGLLIVAGMHRSRSGPGQAGRRGSADERETETAST